MHASFINNTDSTINLTARNQTNDIHAPLKMSFARQNKIIRTVLTLFTGMLVGASFTATVKPSGLCDPIVFVDNPPLSSAMTQRSSEGAYADDNAEYGREHNLVASNLSFPLDGVPSPYESAIRFRAANEAGSDKISLHSYHLMYGPFLAPYLETNVVSINCPCFT